jgi:predicted nucleotidyltransferase
VLRDDFSPQSDIDVIAEFEPGEPVGFIRLGTVEAELSDLLGRTVDLNLKNCLAPAFRERVLSEAEIVYDAAW